MASLTHWDAHDIDLSQINELSILVVNVRLRPVPIEQRKAKLAKLVRGPHPGIVLNEHYDGDGDIVFNHACKLGCQGIVSKRLGSPYRSGRVTQWLEIKNPTAPALTREVLGRLMPNYAEFAD